MAIGKINALEFDKKLEAGKLILSLIGMSNVGKSYWSSHLAKEAGFKVIDCDRLIAKKIGADLGDFQTSASMANWLGQPEDPQYTRNQQKYLDLEIEIMTDIISQLESDALEGNTVIDTTGSIIHTNIELCRRLGILSTVVYLEAKPDLYPQMLRRFLERRKPVIWGNSFKRKHDESSEKALERCYPILLQTRGVLYAEMSHVVMPGIKERPTLNASDFLNEIRSHLPA